MRTGCTLQIVVLLAAMTTVGPAIADEQPGEIELTGSAASVRPLSMSTGWRPGT